MSETGSAWGEPRAPKSPGEIDADRAAVCEREETRRHRLTVLGFCAAVLCSALVALGITGAVLRSHEADATKERETATACVAAGGSWVENSAKHFECRRG